jgi:hypothetical protein
MPFKSQAQRRKFAELLVQGKITRDTFEEWNRETGSAKLPDRVKRKTRKRKTAVKRPTVKRNRSSSRRKPAK